MPEKLLTVKEASLILGISEGEIEGLVKKGELPAYKIGGEFLRFRREQIEAIRDEILAKQTPLDKRYLMKDANNVAYAQSGADQLLDFFYFNDFYLISAIIILLILWFIFFGF